MPAQEKQNLSWFAARTRFGQEIGIRDKLSERGVQYFIPTELRENYRGKKVEHPVINNLVFLRATKERACALKTQDGLPVNYLFDCATHAMLTVPDKQMEDFQRVLGLSIREGGLMDQPLELGSHVRVSKGALRGVEGNVLELQGRFYVVVSLCGCVFARARVPRAWLEDDSSR